MTKLNNHQIRKIIKLILDEGQDKKIVAKHYQISVRRMNQILKYFKDNGVPIELNPDRRPATFLSDNDKKVIEEVFKTTKRGSRLLYYEIQKRGYNIPKNKIQQYLNYKKYSIPNSNKQKSRKRTRYEWSNTGDMFHTDWHRTNKEYPFVIAYLDDASRQILHIQEFDRVSALNSIVAYTKAQENCASYNIKLNRINCDNGSEFVNVHDRKHGAHAFKNTIEFDDVLQVLNRPHHPQTNGKMERFWFEYDKHRWRFNSATEFAEWYSNLIHGELDLKKYLTPSEAVYRKMLPQQLLRLFSKTFIQHLEV